MARLGTNISGGMSGLWIEDREHLLYDGYALAWRGIYTRHEVVQGWFIVTDD